MASDPGSATASPGRTGQVTPPRLTTLDARGNLVERALFFRLLGFEEKKAIRLQYELSMLCVQLDAAGRAGRGHTLVRRCARAAIGELRATDVVSVLSSDRVAILLIGAELPDIGGIAERVTEAMAATLGTPADELRWYGGAASYPRHAGSLLHLLPQVEALILAARAEGKHGLRLPS